MIKFYRRILNNLEKGAIIKFLSYEFIIIHHAQNEKVSVKIKIPQIKIKGFEKSATFDIIIPAAVNTVITPSIGRICFQNNGMSIRCFR